MHWQSRGSNSQRLSNVQRNIRGLFIQFRCTTCSLQYVVSNSDDAAAAAAAKCTRFQASSNPTGLVCRYRTRRSATKTTWSIEDYVVVRFAVTELLCRVSGRRTPVASRSVGRSMAASETHVRPSVATIQLFRLCWHDKGPLDAGL